MTDVSREIGRHDADIDTLKADVRDMKQALARIEAMLHEAKGGWRTLVTVGSVVGATTAGLVEVFRYLKGGG